MAMTDCPAFVEASVPNGNEGVPSTSSFTSARSSCGSRYTTRPLNCCCCRFLAVTSPLEPTTCAFVTTTPLLVIKNPEPNPSELESFRTAEEVCSTKASSGTSLTNFGEGVALDVDSVPVNTFASGIKVKLTTLSLIR